MPEDILDDIQEGGEGINSLALPAELSIGVVLSHLVRRLVETSVTESQLPFLSYFSFCCLLTVSGGL